MTRYRLDLLAAKLTYEPDIEVFTAISGPTPYLAAHYLVLTRNDGLAGLSEVRANIAFLSHIPEAEVAGRIRALCARLPWAAAPEAILDALDAESEAHAAIARASVESLLVDVIAARDDRSHAEILGAAGAAPRHPTNQCLFWSPPATFERLTARYLREGFGKIKVRIGVSDAETDRARLAHVRAEGGPGIEIAVDANGKWGFEEARARLASMEPLGIAYVEQPTAIGDWDALAALARTSSIPIMLDEGLQTKDDVARLIALGPPFLAHLKIVKFGGPRVVVRMAERLQAAGIGVMVGQMNEGGAATALAAAAAIAACPAHAELYGAYGLLDDAVPVVTYDRGEAVLTADRALSHRLDRSRCTLLWTLGDLE